MYKFPIRIPFVNSLVRFKHSIDFSKVPQLIESDLEEQHVRGNGPGGQAVAKTANCVVLKHKPTGIVVKCHEGRALHQNRRKARSLLITKLDNLLNKEESVEAQLLAAQNRKGIKNDSKKQKIRDLKEAWMERENIK